ncbi:serine O-acetyltransferase [Aliterella atlantica]|uniref:Serine acetyltransferase n=1 Tax=Aliterella atlantica CENA595 TaxID=1618023 RepID=A0A0D8ZYP2_9CYAN|nr:hypothetical protein UH38_07845 [Aliterella atlantica CENA595]
MRNALKKTLQLITLPLLLPFLVSNQRSVIFSDVRRWSNIYNLTNQNDLNNLLYLLLQKEFRSLYYYRIHQGNLFGVIIATPLSFIFKKEENLYIWCKNIGSGLFIQHGFSTVISAKSVGDNCWINQQVTVGHNGVGNSPTIGNNVAIRAGAKVIGDIKIGDNVIIGANAVVVKDIPPNCVVVGVPAYIIKRDGIKVYEKLT